MSADLSSSQSAPARASFQSRITAVAMITAVMVLLTACAAFVAEHWLTEQRYRREQQDRQTAMFSRAPAVRRAFTTPGGGASVVRSMGAADTGFRAAYLVDMRGRVVAGYPAPIEHIRGHGRTEARAPVMIDGRQHGVLVTYADPPDLGRMLPHYLALAGAILLAAMGVALLLGRWLAGRVTRPVERLSSAMRAVAASGDFTQRVEPVSNDELGQLSGSFNALLVKLAENDRALRLAMDELTKARDSAESANRSKSQFLANMSHEIRTPLNGLLAMSQVMALEELSGVQRERLDVIRQSGEALLAILNDVLDVSKIEAGKLEIEVDEFDAAAVLSCVHATFAPVAQCKDLALKLEIEPEAEGRRRGDGVRLRQIVSNLVSNALKFTDAGEVRIAAQGLGEGGAGGLRISVSDTGIGIPAAAAPNLFQKFTQADSSTTRRFGGTGLGLAICRQLAELMRGRISVESVEGRGSTFTVELPLPRVAAQGAEPDPAEEERVERGDQPIRVLAAEDNATNQLVLTTVMGIFGVDLTLVENGRQAVEAWRSGGFDLILMDIQMPEMDGLAATRAIRAEEATALRERTPIIALSAHAMTHEVDEYLSAGMDMHVPKPIELTKLQAALEAVLTLGEPEASGQAAA